LGGYRNSELTFQSKTKEKGVVLEYKKEEWDSGDFERLRERNKEKESGKSLLTQLKRLSVKTRPS